MNHATHLIGDASSVAQRFGSENLAIRPEKLIDVLCVNTSGGTLYLQVHEIAPTTAATAPADGQVPKISFPVQAGLGGTLGRAMDMRGIYCCWSSTEATKTIAAASGPIQILIKG